MTITTSKLWCCSISAGLLLASAVATASTPPIKLSVSSPKAKGNQGLLQDDGWNLTFRLRSATAPSYFEIREFGEGGSDFDLLVLEDPDSCLNLSHANTVGGEFEADCPGGQDETFITFNVSPAAAPRLQDRNCATPFADTLKDTPLTDLISQGGSIPFTDANKSYYFESNSFFSRFLPAGPNTEDSNTSATINDCYGYGADEDLPSLVVMADTGGAKIFDTDLTYDNSRIRNMAGLISSVGYELLNRNNETAVVANLFVTNGMLEPQVFVDLGANALGFGPYTNPEFKFRVNGGAIQTVNLAGNFTRGEYAAAIQEAIGTQSELKLRTVVVQGTAPNFIDDLDNNGKFNKQDLILAGYTLLSNQTVTKLNLISRESLRVEEDGFECPNNLLYTDLDSDGQAGDCQDGDGTSRSSMRVPR